MSSSSNLRANARRFLPAADRLEGRRLLAARFDPDFGVGGKAVHRLLEGFSPVGAAIQGDGKVVVVGDSGTGSGDVAVVRLLADGSLDPAFGEGGIAAVPFDPAGRRDSERSVALAIDGAGRIVVGGNVSSWAESIGDHDVDFAVARLTTDGRLDDTFGSGGRAVVAFDLSGANGGLADNDDRLTGLTVGPDGSITLAGSARMFQMITRPGSGPIAVHPLKAAMARLTADGLPDATFGTDGRRRVDLTGGGFDSVGATALAARPDGGYLIAAYDESFLITGTSGRFLTHVARIGRDGSLEGVTTRTERGWSEQVITAMATLPDGRAVMTGGPSSSIAGPYGQVGMIDAQGRPDAAFERAVSPFQDDSGQIRRDSQAAFSNLDGLSHLYRQVATAADGAILYAGTATSPFGLPGRLPVGGADVVVARTLADGTLTGVAQIPFDLAGVGKDAGVVAIPLVGGGMIVVARVQVGERAGASGDALPVYGLGVLKIAALTLDGPDTPPAVVPPTVLEVIATIDSRRKAVKTMTVRFSAGMDARSLRVLRNFELRSAGRDRRFGNKDDAVIRLARPTVSADGTSVTFRVRGAATLSQALRFQVQKVSSSLRDTAGTTLDGDGNGTPGGLHEVRFGRAARG